jgi:hypothetical protein
VRLTAPVDGVTPLKRALGLPEPGERCTAVGFGRYDAPAGGVTDGDKREASELIVGTSAAAIEVEMATGFVDPGDSGGPLLCDGAVVGVTSCKADGAWPAPRRAHYARLDVVSTWIDTLVEAWAGGHADGGGLDCGLSVCAQGNALPDDCDACVTLVCGNDPFCCSLGWDGLCVAAAGDRCGVRCV